MQTTLKVVAAGLLTLALAPTAVLAQAGLPAITHANNPNYPSSSEEPPCEYAMGHLRRVSVKQIKGIDDSWRVWIRPVCEDSPHAPVRNMGNATQLIGAIGRNETLDEALGEKRYLADDVVGVQLTKGNRVTLWVHPSLYR
ncbi:MAG TPA: hypothetical protein VIN06_05180 [Devosia sp.]